MNRALRIIFSRYGIVIIILVLVLGVIALANRREDNPLDGLDSSDGSESEAASEEFTEDDGLATDDCEGDDCYTDEALPQEAVDRAVEFAEAWLNPNGYDAQDWYDSIAPMLTTERAELMEGVDPTSVPATAITGEATADGPKVGIPLDTGTLTLTMAEGSNDWTDGGWLVSAIDWEES